MLLCVRLDTVCHCCYDQLWCRHFVKHVERNTPHISLGGTQSILWKRWILYLHIQFKVGPSIVFPQFFIVQNQMNAQISVIYGCDLSDSNLLKDWEWKPAIVFRVKVQKLVKVWHQRFEVCQLLWTITVILAKKKYAHIQINAGTNNWWMKAWIDNHNILEITKVIFFREHTHFNCVHGVGSPSTAKSKPFWGQAPYKDQNNCQSNL